MLKGELKGILEKIAKKTKKSNKECKIIKQKGKYMASKYLSALSKDDYSKLTKKLWDIQNHKCFICEEEINLELNSTNIDHIKPLANKGKDSEENFAVTHESCNKSKKDANLKIARVLARLKKIQDNIYSQENKSASLND